MKSHFSQRVNQSLRRSSHRRLFLNLEQLEDRRLLAADLGFHQKPPIDLDLNAPAPFHYVADGRAIGLSPVSGELLVGTRRELGFNVSELFSANPVALGIAEDHEVHLGVSREVQLDRSWVRDILPLSNRLVSLKIEPQADWNAELAELFSSFSIEGSPSAEDFWTAPVLRNAESGLRQWVTDEVIVMLEPGIDPEHFFSDSMFAGYRNLLGTSDQFIAKVRDASGLETLELSNQILPTLSGVVWSTVNFRAEVQRNFTPNDPLYPTQWHLNNTGQSSAAVDADIDANLAWDVVTGDAGVVIAILDDGVQLNHPDLAIWSNPNELSTPNGLDDDGNGWIDDINGLNLVDGGTLAEPVDDPSLNDPNPVYITETHGTLVAGSAATRGNNGLGIAAPAFGTKIMALKPVQCVPDCFASFGSFAQATYYAAGRTANGIDRWRGADVINISYGFSPNSADTTALNWATTNGRNGLGTAVFASTGNGASGAILGFVQIEVPSSTNPGAQVQFRYSKDGSISAGEDTVWINWAQFPNGTVERFDNIAGPPGWTGGGNIPWGWASTPETGRAHGTGRYPLRSGAITHNQTSSIFTPEFNSSGAFAFQFWTSTQSASTDRLEALVRYRNSLGNWGPFNTVEIIDSNLFPLTSRLGGVAPFEPNAAYPANLASVIGVGASTDWDYKAGYSQYGPGLDFVAPSGGGTVDFLTTDLTGGFGGSGSDYAAVKGTSFSSPLAAGVGALMLSRNPNLTAAQLRSLMQNTAEEIGSVSYPGGVNQFYGHGRINAHQAVLAAGVDSNDRISNALVVPLNSTVGGRLTTTTDVNLHRIIVNAGQRISIDVDHNATDAGTDTFLRLFDASGNQIVASDDDIGPGPEVSNREAYLEHTFAASGQYYIGVSAFGNPSYNPVNGTGKAAVPVARLGNYQLRVDDVSSQMLIVSSDSDLADGKYFNGVTLREAIAFANQNSFSVITFDTAGTFSVPKTIGLLFSHLTIASDVTIVGPGADRLTISAASNSRVFLVDDGAFAQRNVTLSGMTIRGGHSDFGGGIRNHENLSLTEVHLTDNTASSSGGGLTNFSSLSLTRSSITNNQAASGGGIQNESNSFLTIQDSTISGNTDSFGAGGISNLGTAFIIRSTISQNFGGVTAINGSVNVNHSIISGNSVHDVTRTLPFNSTVTSGGYNLIGTGTEIGVFNQPGDQIGVNALLGTLGNYGGRTPIYPLLPGSPAINRGNPATVSPPAFDQRGSGFSRIRGGVIDIGAVEAHPPVVNVIGNLAQPSTTQRNYDLRANEVVFYQFTLPSPVQTFNGHFLVIDTLGSTLATDNDTEIGLYDASGTRLAVNDDYSGLLSRLGFGDTADSSGDLPAGTYYLSASAFNTDFGHADFNVTSTSFRTGNVRVNIELGSAAVPATIVGSFVNHVGYTGGGSSLDTGKSLAKESASPTLLTYNNLINSSRGINGVAFNVQNLAGTVTAADFVFQMSPTGAFNEGANPVAGWQSAPAPPSFLVTTTGFSTSTIDIQWPNNAIANRWLRITVLANANTGLAANEVYYVGHLLGETTGPSGTVFTVAFADITPIRSAAGSTVNSSSIVDIDKNGTVSFADISAMRSNVGSQLTIITIPANGLSAPMFAGLDDDGYRQSLSGNRREQNQLAIPQVGSDKNAYLLNTPVLPDRQMQLSSLTTAIQVHGGLQLMNAQRPHSAAVLKDWLLGEIESNFEANPHTATESLATGIDRNVLSQQKSELEALDAFFAKYK